MSIPHARYVILQQESHLQYIEMPADYAYQLSALNLRLHKEISKLTVADIPVLPRAIAECSDLELLTDEASSMNGLEYIQQLEQSFARLQEQEYPLISLLTEIRALQAQLEQWYEEYEEQQL